MKSEFKYPIGCEVYWIGKNFKTKEYEVFHAKIESVRVSKDFEESYDLIPADENYILEAGDIPSIEIYYSHEKDRAENVCQQLNIALKEEFKRDKAGEKNK